MTSRQTVGGNQSAGSHYARDTPRDLNLPLPAGSILKPRDAFDTFPDVSPTLAVGRATVDFLKVVSALIIVGVTGAGLGFALFIFFFVELH